VALSAAGLHFLGSGGSFLRTEQKLRRKASFEIRRQRKVILVANDRGVRFLRVRVGVNQAKDAPRQPVLHFMGPLHHHLALAIDQQTDMAGGAGRCPEILTDGPGDIFEIPFRFLGREEIAVFTRIVDFVGRSIRSHMAFLAGMGLARHFDGKIMAGVAGRARAARIIQVDATDPLVRPALDNGKFHLPHLRLPHMGAGYLQFSAVAVKARFRLGGRIGRLECHLALLQDR